MIKIIKNSHLHIACLENFSQITQADLREYLEIEKIAMTKPSLAYAREGFVIVKGNIPLKLLFNLFLFASAPMTIGCIIPFSTCLQIQLSPLVRL